MPGSVDARCPDKWCTSKDVYRMVGTCVNCGNTDIIVLYTSGHVARDATCPACGCERVTAKRLATPDEVPVL
jgi:predicted nucleic-acid-binding Zn-ribbon protein